MAISVLGFPEPINHGGGDSDTLLTRHARHDQHRGVLGWEYEASLHVLGEGLTELRDSQEQLNKQSEEQPRQQREQTEASVEKLELSYKGQMKELVEIPRERVEGRLRA